jgi:hypothetical protein
MILNKYHNMFFIETRTNILSSIKRADQILLKSYEEESVLRHAEKLIAHFHY